MAASVGAKMVNWPICSISCVRLYSCRNAELAESHQNVFQSARLARPTMRYDFMSDRSGVSSSMTDKLSLLFLSGTRTWKHTKEVQLTSRWLCSRIFSAPDLVDEVDDPICGSNI